MGCILYSARIVAYGPQSDWHYIHTIIYTMVMASSVVATAALGLLGPLTTSSSKKAKCPAQGHNDQDCQSQGSN